MHNPSSAAVVVGSAAWTGEAERVLVNAGLAVEYVVERATYMDRLLEAAAALILVDGDAPGWQWWVTTPKVRQETRRIPLIVVSIQEPLEDEAFSAGADRFLSADTLAVELPIAVDELARVLDAEQRDLLACQCAEEMPALGEEGIARFNVRDYYGQHDLFEALWMDEPGPVRDLYRAILQVGVAYYHITQGNPRGALKMLRRSAQWFLPLPDVCRGVDVRQLREDATAVEAALHASLASTDAAFDVAQLPPLRTLSDTN